MSDNLELAKVYFQESMRLHGNIAAHYRFFADLNDICGNRLEVF